MSKKFIIGVELLTGLVIGAAAAVAAVSFIIVFLVDKNLAAESGHMATVTAYAISRSIDSYDTAGEFGNIVGPLVRSGSLEAAVIIDSSGNIIAESGLSSEDMPVPGETRDWYFVRQAGSDLLIGVRAGKSSISIIHRTLLIGLAALTAALAVLAFFTPRYLARTVISPLRKILVEADRFSSGSGTDPEAAGASFHRLVELLHERERQLNELREKAEQRAEMVEERSGAILSVLGSAVLAIDGTGKLSLFNRQSKELFSLGDDDIRKEFPWERTPAGRQLELILLSMTRTGNTSSEFQILDDVSKSNRMYSVEISRSRADEIAILVIDVTRISELEKRIADETAMADIGAASAGISHEMGNTLCALSGFVDLLARGHSDERTLNILSEVKREVDSAQDRINSLGNFARSPEPVSSNLGRDDILSICREACRLDTDRCSVEASVDDLSIKADRRLLGSCICNVLKNAIEADSSSAVEISIGRNDKNLIISVADTGPGLSLDREEVFRPFRTTKNRSSGNMGLGLSVSRRIIRSMGGELSGENRTEGGALFAIMLPLQRRR
ncbi:MAG: GHKL domain-containing protein [Candidatus Aegiribacteria sp.]|nr:GHKL domain-containing protein [Candidatus Aegiribacteria sp.]